MKRFHTTAAAVLMLPLALSACGGATAAAPKANPDSGRLSEMQRRWDAWEIWQREGACLEWRSNGPAGYFSLYGTPPDQRPLLTTFMDRNC